jgi:hypothetical protein
MTTTGRRPSRDELRELYDYFSRIAVDTFNRDGAVGPSLFAIRLGTGELIESVVEMEDVMRALHASDETRAKFGPVIVELLREGGIVREDFRARGLPLPDVAVHIVEAPSASSGGTQAPEAPSVGAVLVGVHTRDHSVVGRCPIEGGCAARPGRCRSIWMPGTAVRSAWCPPRTRPTDRDDAHRGDHGAGFSGFRREGEARTVRSSPPRIVQILG